MGIVSVNTTQQFNFIEFASNADISIGDKVVTAWTEDIVKNDIGTWLKMDGQEVNVLDYPDLLGTDAIDPIYSTSEAPPKMTSNTAPAGWKASASSEYADLNYPPWKAFNQELSPGTNTWISASSAFSGDVGSQWLQIQSPEPIVIKKYIVGTSGSYPRPKDFTIQGSNDGVNWNIIDTQTGALSDLTGAGYREFEVESDIAYQYFRLWITKMYATAGYVAVGMFKLFGNPSLLGHKIKNTQPVNGQYTYVKALEVE